MYVDYVNDRGSKSSLCETDPYCIFYTLLCMRAGKYTLRAPPQAHTAERRGADTTGR